MASRIAEYDEKSGLPFDRGYLECGLPYQHNRSKWNDKQWTGVVFAGKISAYRKTWIYWMIVKRKEYDVRIW